MINEVYKPSLSAKRNWFNLAYEEQDQTASAYIYDDIGGFGVKASDFIEEVNSVNSNKLNVYINSYGGEIDEGVAIYNFLKRYKGEVIVHIDGMAASIASIIAMAGSKVIMPKASLLFIHNPWTMTAGDAAELQKAAGELNKRKAALAAIYVEKSGLPSEVIEKLMDEETLLSADEAVELGFADEVIEKVEPQMAYNAVMQHRIVKAMARKLKHEDKNMADEVKPVDVPMNQEPVEVKTEAITPDSKTDIVNPSAAICPSCGKEMSEYTEEKKEEEMKSDVVVVEAPQQVVVAQVEEAVDVRAEFKMFVEKFGQDRAARYFAAGHSIVEAEKSYLSEIEKENAELRQKLASAEVVKPVAARPSDSSDAPMTFTRAQISKMSKEDYSRLKSEIIKASIEGRIK